MGIRWTKTREFEVACELFVREGSGPYVPAEQDDLRRACEAVGLVVESGSDRKSALDDAGQAGFARGCSLHAAKLREATERAEKAERERDESRAQVKIAIVEDRRQIASLATDLAAARSALEAAEARLRSEERERIEYQAEAHSLQAESAESAKAIAAARARIAELEAPLPEATAEELLDICRPWDLAIPQYASEALLAVAARIRRERCLIARAVAGGVGLEMWKVDTAAWRVSAGGNGPLYVPAAEVPAVLARMIGEVGA